MLSMSNVAEGLAGMRTEKRSLVSWRLITSKIKKKKEKKKKEKVVGIDHYISDDLGREVVLFLQRVNAESRLQQAEE